MLEDMATELAAWFRCHLEKIPGAKHGSGIQWSHCHGVTRDSEFELLRYTPSRVTGNALVIRQGTHPCLACYNKISWVDLKISSMTLEIMFCSVPDSYPRFILCFITTTLYLLASRLGAICGV